MVWYYDEEKMNKTLKEKRESKTKKKYVWMWFRVFLGHLIYSYS